MTSTSQLFGSQSYTRGAMTYEALRAAIGDPAFFQLIKQWQTDYSGQTKHWNDLIDLAEQISGRDLTAFFQDWIYDANKPAWPGKLSLVLGASPASGAVAAGSTLTYQLSATNTGKVPLTGAVVSVDLANVLDDATIGALPAGLALAGTTLTWTVPTTPLSGVATTSFPVTVRTGRHPGQPPDGDKHDLDPGRHVLHLHGHAHRRPAGGHTSRPHRAPSAPGARWASPARRGWAGS